MSNLPRTILIALLFLALPAESAPSCTDRTAADVLAGSEQIFVGRATKVTPHLSRFRSLCHRHSKQRPECGGKTVSFTVEELLQGSLPNEVNVSVGDACGCNGTYIDPGKDYLVVIDPISQTMLRGRLQARTVCWGTGEINDEFSRSIIDLSRAKSEEGG
ncbi:MAG: hypothetical protein AAGA23_12065 [Pseudomonadota bacterium]